MLLLTGCRDQPYGQTATGTSSAIVAEPGAVATPIALKLTPEMEAAAEAAAIHGAYLDAQCAEIADISAELAVQRPDLGNGKAGCPRPEGAPETWGAQ